MQIKLSELVDNKYAFRIDNTIELLGLVKMVLDNPQHFSPGAVENAKRYNYQIKSGIIDKDNPPSVHRSRWPVYTTFYKGYRYDTFSFTAYPSGLKKHQYQFLDLKTFDYDNT